MKKFVVLMLAICSICIFTSCSFIFGNFKYTLINDGAEYEVSCYSWAKVTNVDIPSTYKNKPVTSIGEKAFYWCKSLQSITIPNSVTNIGKVAFYNCDSLQSIIIPNSVTSIGDGAFSECDSLQSITIPNSVTSIGKDAFSGCDSLQSITIPNSVTSIGDGAFSDCDSLVYNIKDNLKYLGNESNPYLYLVDATIGNKTTAVIDNNCKFIGDYAFYECGSLQSITIPNSVTNIGYRAFYMCDRLESITIPNSVTSIDEEAFYGSSLESITIPNSVVSIGNYAFGFCTRLESITVEDNNKNYKSIDGNLYNKDATIFIVYAKGKKDTSFTMPQSVTSISDRAFAHCYRLTKVVLPRSLINIGYDVFETCFGLENITIEEDNKNYKSVDGNLYSKDGTFLIQYAMGKKDTTFTIPDGVTSIRSGAFELGNNIEVIIFNGTIEQWKNVSKYAGWFSKGAWDSKRAYVQCSDGRVEI